MSIKRTAKIGASVLFLVFIISSALSSFFIYKMKNNFTQVETLLTRYTDVMMARYELAIMRSNVNFLAQDTALANEKYIEIIEKNKNIAIRAKKTMGEWVKEKKVSIEAQQSVDAIAKLFYNLVDRLIVISNDPGAIKVKDKEFDQDFEKLNTLFDNYVAIKAKNSASLINNQKNMVEFSLYSTIISLLILVFILCFVIIWVNKIFISNLHSLSDILNKVGKGELVFTLPKMRKDEFGELFFHVGNMQKALISTILTVKRETLEIKRGASEIASGNQELSSRTEEQASALQQTAASMEEIKTAVANNTENTQEANVIINQSNDIVRDGASVMKEAISSMKKIEQGALKVGEINDVINNLASQTNILALNAAVEAARAGEQGRGFTVVAAEVRNLASKSADAAKEISQILKASIEDVAEGTSLVNKTGEHMQEIVASIAKVNNIMKGISLASEEQRVGIEQIAVAINQMDTVVQQNASLVDQGASSTMMLDEKAQVLMDNVAVFQIEEQAL
ncbi:MULTISPECIES: methyl-accepting chemotaxis protein [Proteus]|jgi:methyl-accepting chemotaxis protein|uniref:methyl-accepting chemotaxis protein n=1 Tax=Proteus TaxID=583 RepID=UPI000B40F546|nr:MULTISPECIES: methyl-accepting chemotaxis protein [Proteus]RNT24152.1 methyl-accepting chemotaxis protein [Proteus mirabilis]AYY81911.1 methyl-accepting chemotaxis protein [Proteus vulgaris]MBG5970879.1 methyl-accepting chemotaxis protein [Proteus vulgaris]MBG5986199.1 methyl-accepting chemotaxis protein [Proteus vulgaris]MBI6512848.1 methyl-accepting chemotaxis protein [Proteus sp. PR00174]